MRAVWDTEAMLDDANAGRPAESRSLQAARLVLVCIAVGVLLFLVFARLHAPLGGFGTTARGSGNPVTPLAVNGIVAKDVARVRIIWTGGSQTVDVIRTDMPANLFVGFGEQDVKRLQALERGGRVMETYVLPRAKG